MTPEMRLAQFLSGNEETQKIRAEVRGFSLEELEGLLKTANGDMLQYFQDHPEKLKEKQERDAKKEKRSSSEPETNQAESSKIQRKIEKEEKLPPQELLKKADAWGRELARMDMAKEAGDVLPFKRPGLAAKALKGAKNVLKGATAKGKEIGSAVHRNRGTVGFAVGAHLGVAAGKKDLATAEEKHKKQLKKAKEKKASTTSKAVEGATKLYHRYKGPVGDAAKAVGNKAYEGVKTLGHHIGKIQDPILKGTAIGAVTGGAGGAVSGLLDPKEDPYTGEKHRMRSAMRRGLSGAAGGAATGALFGSIGKTSAVSSLEKAAAGLNMAGIGSMAKNFVGSMKPVAEKAMGAIKPMAQNAMAKAAPMAQKALGGKTMGQAAGMGAAAGGALGAAKGLVAPGKNSQGQPNSRIGAMARGAVGGAALGAGAGAGAKAALPAMKNAYKAVTPGLVHAPQMASKAVTMPG